ncbi:GFA family protein [Sphingobium sufflavum]|uniref:GFA family protein n=1 Tax=Sphingobium sufflavum TaxID=1129547 RepID=UPI001F2317BA|nr:GFA family protein [Sphingobium sufflavum]MCE7795409.1 GFA family protein [Sphingobium sufflavum]
MSDTETHDGAQSGGCLCGQVRYRFSGAPLLTAVCHCRHCQKQGGSAFSVVCAIPAAAYEQSGETRIFADRGESGKGVARHFCPDCGSPIISVAEALPDMVIVKAGTMDDFAAVRPDAEAYCDSALSWLPVLAPTRFPRSNI